MIAYYSKSLNPAQQKYCTTRRESLQRICLGTTLHKTLFHTPFLLRGRAITLLEYRDMQVLFEVDDWFNTLPAAVQRYLLPLQSQYITWYNENVRDLPQNYTFCEWCKQKTANMQRHYMQHHMHWRTIWFCPLPGCPISSPNKGDL